MITGNYIFIIILVHDYKCGHICINKAVIIKRAGYLFLLRIVVINRKRPLLILSNSTNPKKEDLMEIKNQMPVNIKSQVKVPVQVNKEIK